MRLVKSTELCEGGGQVKIRYRIVSVRLDRPAKPGNRLLVTPEAEFCEARETLPGMSIGIARTEAQGLTDVSLCFFGTTDENLTKSDKGMGAGKISIQLQRAFTFGNALQSALGQYFDIPQQPMGARVVWDRRQGFGQLRFGCCEGRDGIGHKEICALAHVQAG